MQTIAYSALLRLVLRADALISGVVGLIMWLAAESLMTWLSLPETLLRAAGLVLLCWAVLVGWLAQRQQLASGVVWLVIIANVLWAIDCIVMITPGRLTPSVPGYVFIVIQIIVVLALAELQYVGLRRSLRSVNGVRS